MNDTQSRKALNMQLYERQLGVLSGLGFYVIVLYRVPVLLL